MNKDEQRIKNTILFGAPVTDEDMGATGGLVIIIAVVIVIGYALYRVVV